MCQADGHFFIGLSARTNEQGAQQLTDFLEEEGFTSALVDIRGIDGILHLKSGISWLGDNRLVLIDAFVGHAAFNGYEIVVVEPEENYAVEAGFDQSLFGDKLALTAIYFHNSFRNQIEFQFNDIDFTSQYVNINRSFAQGAEVELRGRIQAVRESLYATVGALEL